MTTVINQEQDVVRKSLDRVDRAGKMALAYTFITLLVAVVSGVEMWLSKTVRAEIMLGVLVLMCWGMSWAAFMIAFAMGTSCKILKAITLLQEQIGKG